MKRPKKLSSLSYRAIGDETIILDTKINREVHQLNALGTFIWDLCDGQHTVNNIVDKVCEEFESVESEVREDVFNFILELENKFLFEEEQKS
jgi:methyltransferase-like protein